MGTAELDDEARNRWHRDAIAGLTAALLEDPDAAVAYYPGWTLRDLAVHVVRVHVMACTSLAEGDHARPSYELDVDPQTSPNVLADELDRVAQQLRGDVETCPHTSVWTPTPSSSAPPAFWRRRMLSESVLHRWDAESALGRAWAPGPGLVEEVIDEFLASRIAPGGTGFQSGLVVLDVDTARWPVGVAGTARATVTADPVGLWLWLNRRAGSEGLRLGGDPGAVARLEATLEGLRPARR